jgi:hypothetical protein
VLAINPDNQVVAGALRSLAEEEDPDRRRSRPDPADAD